MAQKYKQEKRLNYVEIFVVVVKFISYKCFFAIGVKRNYQMHDINVFLAFLYGFSMR